MEKYYLITLLFHYLFFFLQQYEYEAEMEESYRSSLLKSFKKQIDDGYFNFIMVDCINDKIGKFLEMHDYAKLNSFEV